MTELHFYTCIYIVDICIMARRSKKEMAQLKEWAEYLFIHSDISQKEIANKVGVTEKTITDWKEEGSWETIKATTIMSKPKELNRIYMQINELNTHIMSREKGLKFASSKEADALKKLTSSAKDLEGELGLSAVVNVSTELLEFVKKLDYPASQTLHHYIDLFIKEVIND